MKRKMNKTCKWLALGATLALGSAFVVPAVFNESPVAIEETVNAETTTYQEVDGVSIVTGYNHKLFWEARQTVFQFTSGGTTVTMDKTVDEGNFFTNSTIDIDGTVTTLKESKFNIRSYDKTINRGATYYDMICADGGSWVDPAEGEMYTVTIPEGTVVYDCKFSQDVELYFFDGAWTTVNPLGIEYTEITNILIEPGVNHSLVWGTHRHLVFYFQVNGQNQKPDRTLGEGNFFSKVTFEGKSLTESGFVYQNAPAYASGTPVYLQYVDADWTDPEEGEVYKMTIPAGTTLHNFKIKSEINVYFYEGKWSLTERVSESEKVYTSPSKLVIQSGWNGSDWGGKKNIIMYAWPEGVLAGIKHNFAYGQGNFNEKTTLIEYTNGVQTAVYEDKVNFVQTAHVTDGGTVIHLQYDTDDEFWAKTTDKYYQFNIPVGTTLYATKFETEMNLYYINGYWSTMAPDEVASVYGANLSLTGNIGVNFYVNIPAATLSDADAYVQIKHGETTKEIPVSEGVEKNGYYVFTHKVTSAQMADDIALTVLRNIEWADGNDVTDNASVTLHYSVEKYAEDYARYCQENPDSVDEKLTALVNAMVAYGDYANAYFNDGDALADIESVTAADFEGVAATQKGESANVSDITASLVMGSETSIKVYFKYTGEGAPVCKVAGQEVTATYDEEKGMYYIAKRNINAANLDITYTFEIDGFIFTYSAYVYFKDVIETSADTELVNLVKAAYLYSLAAETYFVA